jgi:hypothetical protein
MLDNRIEQALQDAMEDKENRVLTFWNEYRGHRHGHIVLTYALLTLLLEKQPGQARGIVLASKLLQALRKHAPVHPWSGGPIIADELIYGLLDAIHTNGLDTVPFLLWYTPYYRPQREAGMVESLNDLEQENPIDRATLLINMAQCHHPPLTEPLEEALAITKNEADPTMRLCALSGIAVALRPCAAVRAKRIMRSIIGELETFSDRDDQDELYRALLPDIHIVLGYRAALTIADRIQYQAITVDGLLQLANHLRTTGLEWFRWKCLARAVNLSMKWSGPVDWSRDTDLD